MIAIIGGTSIFSLPILQNKKARSISTKYGESRIYSLKHYIILNRHGIDKDIPPHRINYSANLAAIKSLGIEKVVALNSCGSLHKEIKPGVFIVPDDYINFDVSTIFNNRIKHIIPGFNAPLRKICVQILKELNLNFKSEGIYVQTRGPRFETKAEVNLLKDYADIVGMTLSSEATIAKELGLKYASICCVDNYANGVVSRPLSYEIITKNAEKNLQIWEKIIDKLQAKKSSE